MVGIRDARNEEKILLSGANGDEGEVKADMIESASHAIEVSNRFYMLERTHTARFGIHSVDFACEDSYFVQELSLCQHVSFPVTSIDKTNLVNVRLHKAKNLIVRSSALLHLR